jgi:aminopeptidase N
VETAAEVDLGAQLTTTPRPAPPRDLLTREEAETRARRVADVDYELSIDLPTHGSIYSGSAVITFSVTSLDDPLFIDWKGMQVTALTVNGRDVQPDVRDNRIWLDGSLLTPHTSVCVEYRNEFDSTGDGFHRFVDPEDGSVYVYSNFQPFAAHRLFPCFDQPDLKATFRLDVIAPADWAIVSASLAESTEPADDGRRRHRFSRTERFSTYLFPLVGGPYEVIRDEHRGIPLALYTRRSLARQMASDSEELFEVTKQGFDYYAELFAQPYPFSKYDQLFMPEFNVGAMENVGAVTIHDSYVFRDPPTDTQRLDRAEVILHELAHMWFGNLVTMRWWDDLWLNESFATYISFLALTEATRFKTAWRTFNGAVKLPAYRADQLPTTHPISADATDTETALLNFDDITYGKGASVLKQLVAKIGHEGFRDGMRAYFKRHAWGNATLADFLGALQEGSGTDLDRWAHLWLETSSVNTINVEYGLADGTVAMLRLEQSAPAAYPTLRPHAMQVALVTDVAEGLRIVAVPAQIDGPSAEVTGAEGLPAPVLVFPNHGDDDYALARLDPLSIDFALNRLHELDDPLLRQLLWTSLWDMVWDVRLPSTAYLEAARRNLPLLDDIELLESVLGRSTAALAAYVPQDRRDTEARALLVTALDAIRNASSRDARMIWMRAAIGFATTPEHLEPLLDLVDGRAHVEDLTIDQDMRWALAMKGVAYGSEEAEERVAAERVRDPSDRGQRAMIRAAAARPTAEAKSETWERIHGDGYGSYQLTRAAMQGFQSTRQRDLLLPYREPFFEGVREVFATRDHPFARSYLLTMLPDLWAEPDVVQRSRLLLQSLDPDEQSLDRLLREKIDDLERAIRARALVEARS